MNDIFNKLEKKQNNLKYSYASPGPFTAQPIVAIVIFLSRFLNRASTFLANPIKSIWVLPQVGQDTKLTPRCLSFKLF